MKSVCILPLAIVLATTSSIAQDIVVHSGPNSVSLNRSPLLTDPANCPVGLRVNHGSSFVERKTEYGPFAPPAPAVQGQRIHLTVTNPSLQEIVRAQITVHGFSDKWRALPLVSTAGAPDLAKNVRLVLDVKGNGNASSDLSLSRFTAITAVDLNSLTYADGSTWQNSSPGACSVAPDPFMLVSAAR